MDILLSAVASDLISRLVTSIIKKYQKKTSTSDRIARLQRVLLRARTIIEEADGRHITNQGMLLQLEKLRDGMYRGYYVLDAFKKRAVDLKRHVTVSQCLDLSLCKDGINKLQSVLQNLEVTLCDMKESVVFLMDCPRITRQPYSIYLFMDTCMFGRSIEKEQIINFLQQPCSSKDPVLGVLPIIGPPAVGKRTLVEHVCSEERVRKHFSQIMYLDGDALLGDCHIVHSSGRSLLVIELVCEVDEVAWRKFYSSICYTSSDSKVILISRMEKVSNLGTMQALRLKSLRQEEYWYFFKVLAFGSANPEDHPELASIAMKLATELKGSFVAANIGAKALRANLNIHFWREALKIAREWVQSHLVILGEHPCDPRRTHPSFVNVFGKGSSLLAYNRCKVGRLMRNKLPKIGFQDILTGRITPCEEKIEVLVWESPIAPYHCYIANFHYGETKPQQVLGKNRLRGKSTKRSIT